MSCFKTSDVDSPLISTHHQKQTRTLKKTLRSLSCASQASSAAATPASLEAVVEWNGKKSKRTKQEKKEKRRSKDEIRNHSNHINFENGRHRDEFGHDEDDVWYGNHDDESVNFVMSHRRHHHMMMYGGMLGRNHAHDADRIQREIMMLQTRMMSGGMNSFDRYRDWRLDVDRMSYEELLELGDKIGHVNTGLREEEISHCLSKMKHPILDAKQLLFSNGKDKKCSICQEEFEVNEDIGKLGCSHSYHTHCIRQWLLQKNACPVCKTAVTKT